MWRAIHVLSKVSSSTKGALDNTSPTTRKRSEEKSALDNTSPATRKRGEEKSTKRLGKSH